MTVSVHGLTTGSSQKGCLSLKLPSGVIRTETGKSACIHCNVNLHCYKETPDVLWFVFYANSHHELLQGSRYNITAGTLTIHSLSPNASGNYLCAVRWKMTPSQVEMGTVTTLVVRGKSIPRYLHF